MAPDPVGLADTCIGAEDEHHDGAQTASTTAMKTVNVCCDSKTKRIKIIIRGLSLQNHRVFSWDKVPRSKRKADQEELVNTCVTAKKPRQAAGRTSSLDGEPTSENSFWVPELGLRLKDRAILMGGDWLTDNHIVAAQRLLRRQFPDLEGLQEPVLGNVLQFKPIISDGIQVMQNGNNHWVTLRKYGAKIKVMDSKNMGLTRQLTHQLINLCGQDAAAADRSGSETDSLEVRLPRMHRQRGSSDCGVFALAYATELAFQGNPELVVYEQKRLRQHLESCLEFREISPFPKKTCKERTAREIGERSQLVMKVNLHVPTVVESSVIERSP